MPNSVSATSLHAGAGAAVGLHVVTVITRLALVDSSVTTDLRQAACRAAVVAEVVTIITFFVPLITGY